MTELTLTAKATKDPSPTEVVSSSECGVGLIKEFGYHGSGGYVRSSKSEQEFN
jgi:hypothetical protein